MKQGEFCRSIEQLLEAMLNGTSSVNCDRSLLCLARDAQTFECKTKRVVAFGGGTGLSTVVGGNSQLGHWPENPFTGLKEVFPQLDIVVCTTDDGGSTGLLLKQLPIIGIGDLRKILLSSVRREQLKAAYALGENETMQVVRLVHRVFNHRFPPDCYDFECIRNPLLAVPDSLRKSCPEALATLLCSLGEYLTPAGEGPTIPPGGHCLGNLILIAAILRQVPFTGNETPDAKSIEKGLDMVGRAIGVPPGRLHPATSTPGQLVLRYSNGVAVRGQWKSGCCRRDFPIDGVAVEFSGIPVVDPGLCQTIRDADLIIIAPGSLYTSIMPILQLPPIVNAIKENERALKILGANFWVQDGETDISRRGRNRGFYVSEMVEAYGQNVPGGAEGLFDIVLSANLEHMPGNVLSNYALEGKCPIYLDRTRVERFGVLPLEATIYSMEQLRMAKVIHHDPEKFAIAIRTLLFAHERWNLKRASLSPVILHSPFQERGMTQAPTLCAYNGAIDRQLADKQFLPEELRQVFREVCWENRDIRIEHLDIFRGVKLVPAVEWGRSNEWDNVLGYYDPEDGFLKIHEDLKNEPDRLKGNLLIALGESLLGRYLEDRRWMESQSSGQWGFRSYEIRLRPVGERECLLDDSELRAYLSLARMVPNPEDASTYRITLNGSEGFIPPGLLFGLLYAWYLNNGYVDIMEIEMSMLRWPSKKLIPCQLQERNRKLALISFFRKVVFRHTA